ncbi:hypothetical protein GTP23_13150 [Pseudoduganella sp. FT93W]|uniref:HAD family hydrolase n=1 Tax=Duganella fentianensis TaxID=2692177 RepID=A0A845I3W5_9BURK|nr:HAD domain-containing protein [Duganella fentianensis]MYN45996.1 hypothetical protein [Duganella fentianensis]
MILFLDFDGVLHPDITYGDSALLCKLPVLEDVLRRRPAVQVVVSSTWREKRSLLELQSLFSADIAPRIIDLTPAWREVQSDEDFGAYVRQAEIESWLRTTGRVWESWVAIDDQPHLFRPFCKNLLAINPATGLTEADAKVLELRLGAP